MITFKLVQDFVIYNFVIFVLGFIAGIAITLYIVRYVNTFGRNATRLKIERD